MIVDGILPFARKLIQSHIDEHSIVVDATCGNGNDTLFLANQVRNGQVYAFDIQAEAILNTKVKTQEFNNIHYFQLGHEHAASIINNDHPFIDATIFNLGYLPKGDKQITTNSHTTIEAIQTLFNITKKDGIIVLVVYPGHPEGQIESNEVNEFVKSIDQQDAHVLHYQFINQKNNPPYIIAIEKRN
ncbi:class I SAM-dependent methyltransferase [Mammaliicoccus stepanovicii]|uniref:rRNA methylase n=1 Tax=Mammaliicoccus stepanovicii TaxID=643214 RepID=A0A239YZZ6_9STAP|nr:class I SAM-dependent methyltransferase [Mammaliicoccus stepanovicii]PNZ79263.1 rRNA methyltransferase [Mammaliicoccus stepanovicii]GGI40485.1 rRNA methyltransferase [Mammaliicoccus stepanovicii]SNV63824.1 rRNA methylase [Mammaliicoccus stepanovicii]